MKSGRIGALLGLCALVGCVEAPTPENYPGEYEEALCAWAYGCGVFTSKLQCRDSLVWDTSGRFQYLGESVAAGRMKFDADATKACFEAIEVLPCDQQTLQQILFSVGPTAAPEPCQEVFVGKVRNYDPCLSSEECVGEDPVCGFPPTCTEACCVGACRDRGGPPAVGEACTGACEAGAYCAFDPMTGAQTCAKQRAAGESCADDQRSCAEELFCDDDGAPVCRQRLAAGAPCDWKEQCAEGLECYRVDSDTRMCQSLPAEGEPCHTGNYPVCARFDNYCDPSSRCALLPGAGEPCQDYSCAPFAECRNSDGTPVCQARASLGEPCGEAADYVSCIGHLWCGEDERCVAPDPEPVCDVPE